MLHTADFALVWPRDLFLHEAQVLLYDCIDGEWIERAELLLEEAFAGPAPRDAIRGNVFAGPWEPGPRGVVEALVEQADQLREAPEPRPYWSERRGGHNPSLNASRVMDEFVRLVGDLEGRGYFERAFPTGCVDGGQYCTPEHASEQLEDRLGVPDLWPLPRSRLRWTRDLFFDLMEALHDVVARPRSRFWHDHAGCGWHYANFALEPGQRLYRWRINRLLDRSDAALRLAQEGGDVGRLVVTTDEARAELISTMVEREGTTAGRVRHALALFRAREATEHDKRSAVVVLAGVLEERRGLLKDHLLRKDERSLFQIANEFALRHQTESQKADYDPDFLDWVFWWYLATIELSDRLLAKRA